MNTEVVKESWIPQHEHLSSGGFMVFLPDQE